MIYIYAACILSLAGAFVARHVVYALNKRERGGDVNSAELVAILILDAIGLTLFSFAFVQILDYVKGAA